MLSATNPPKLLCCSTVSALIALYTSLKVFLKSELEPPSLDVRTTSTRNIHCEACDIPTGNFISSQNQEIPIMFRQDPPLVQPLPGKRLLFCLFRLTNTSQRQLHTSYVLIY
jgi:hypothetical protein